MDSISFAIKVRGVFVVLVVVFVQVGVEDQKKCLSIFDFYRLRVHSCFSLLVNKVFFSLDLIDGRSIHHEGCRSVFCVRRNGVGGVF